MPLKSKWRPCQVKWCVALAPPGCFCAVHTKYPELCTERSPSEIEDDSYDEDEDDSAFEPTGPEDFGGSDDYGA